MSIANEALGMAIRSRLAQDCRVGALAIDVECCDGCVCLKGCVDNVEQKDLAVTLISGVIGVRAVQDELLVRGLTAPAGASTEDAVAF